MSVDFNDLEQQNGLPSGLLSAVQQQESGGDSDAVSSKGAVGSFQFMPATAKQYGIDPTDPDQAAQGAAAMFGDLSKKYNGDLPSMLAAYNWGQGNLDKKGMENAPQETQDYIKNITSKLSKSAPSQIGVGTQYAAADTGNMSDATVDNSVPAPSKMDLMLEAESRGILPSDKQELLNEARSRGLISGGQQPQGLIDALKSRQQQPESQFYHNLGKSDNANFPNVKEEGTLIPREVTYNPDGTIDSTRADFMAPLRHFSTGVGDILQSAENESTDTTPEAVSAMMGMSGAPALTKGIAATGEAIIPKSFQSLMADETSAAGPISNIVKSIKGEPAPVYDSLDTHSAISDSYGAAKQSAAPYYNFMHDVASSETADATDLKPQLDAIIADIKNTPFHEAASELPYLEQQSAKIGEDGRMPLNDMVRLKQNLNTNFNPKRFAQDTPYGKVGSLVDDSLEDASQRIPEFGEAKSLADKNWLNTVKSPFEDNTVLQKFWRPEDYYAKKSVNSGMLEELPDPTKQRAAAMLSNIKTPVQLNAVRRVIPQDMANTLSQAKIQDITQGAGMSRLNSAGKAIMGAPNLTPSGIGKTLTNIGQAIGGVPLKQAQKDLIAAAKSPPPTLSTKYQQPFSALKANVQQHKDLAGEMQPFGVDALEEKALPEPQGTASDYFVPEGHAKGGIIKNREIHLSKKLEVKLGRKPKAREVELASYVGAHGVHRLLNQKDVSMPAHKMFPEATVKEKRELFFNKKKPYTVKEIKKALG